MADFIQVPPDSTGKKVAHKAYNDGVDDKYTQIVHVGDRFNPENIQSVNDYGAALTTFQEGQPGLGGFGTLRVSEETSLGHYDHTAGEQEYLYHVDVADGGTKVYDSQSSSVTLSTSGVATSKSIRTTNRYHYYLPGTGGLVFLTLALSDNGKTGNTREWGYHDDTNGLYFYLDGTEFGVSIRSDATGTVTERKVSQANFNGDRLDGMGVSGYNIDLSKTNLFWISFAWLGVGAVRFGIYGDKGERIIVHTFINANGEPYPYMRTASLPIRFANYNTGAVGSTSEIKQICSAVYSDHHQELNFRRFGDVETPAPREVTTNTPVLSVRPKLLNDSGLVNRSNLYPESVTFYITGGSIKYQIYWDTENDLTGDTWLGSSKGLLEFDYEATAVDVSTNDAWRTIYLDEGVHTIDVRGYYELNDEAILLRGENETIIQQTTSFVCTKLSGTTVNVSIALNYREKS